MTMLFVCDFCQQELNKHFPRTMRFFMLPATRIAIEREESRERIVQPIEEDYRVACYRCLGVSK